jgi:thaumarchaeosortase
MVDALAFLTHLKSRLIGFVAFLNNLKSTPVLLIVIAVALPIAILTIINPASFSQTWKGRTFYLFFLWLLLLELILDWDSFKLKVPLNNKRTVLLVIASILPIAYVLASNFTAFRSSLLRVGELLEIPFAPYPPAQWIYDSWLLSIEYLITVSIFAAMVWIAYGVDGFKAFSSSMILLGAIGSVYMIDTLYPLGYFTPLQAFVPFTASLAASVLGWLGYQTSFGAPSLGMPLLTVSDSSGQYLTGYYIGWPCAGIQSFLIYTFVMLLFLKKTKIPKIQKLVYFVIGAIITYAINILRIVSIYLAFIQNLSQGIEAANAAMRTFHNFYGGLFAMTWIVLYPLLIIGTRILWFKIHSRTAS